MLTVNHVHRRHYLKTGNIQVRKKLLSRLRQALMIITKVGAGIIATMTLLAFFSVKPLPYVEAHFGNLDDSCQVGTLEYSYENAYLGPKGGVSDLTNFIGQIIYLDLDMSIATYEDNPCGFMSTNSEKTILWGEDISSSFFEVDTRIKLTSKGNREPDSVNNEEKVSLLLPALASTFVEVSRCEGHCYKMAGPVRVQKAFSSDGWVGLALRPVNMYENSYLTAGYECRLKVLGSRFGWIAPIYCALF